jgi:hypothetical protein
MARIVRQLQKQVRDHQPVQQYKGFSVKKDDENALTWPQIVNAAAKWSYQLSWREEKCLAVNGNSAVFYTCYNPSVFNK